MRPAGAPALTSFQLGRFGTENFQQIVSKANETARGLIGAEGDEAGRHAGLFFC